MPRCGPIWMSGSVADAGFEADELGRGEIIVPGAGNDRFRADVGGLPTRVSGLGQLVYVLSAGRGFSSYRSRALRKALEAPIATS